uniref:Pectinesterase inhibitor domain-containing protein n=2 Tax=Quercus lobata TaxID=97700 RepID=A0A7N2KVP1_QUELO
MTNMDFQGHVLVVNLTFYFYLLFLFFHSPLQTNASSSSSSTKLIESVCKNTIDNANCLKALESDPRAVKASRLKDLAKIALELAVANATESKAYIDALLTKNHTEPIKQCSFWFEAVVGSFRSALRELDEDVLSANYDSKIAGDDADSCENALALGKVQIPSISTRNNYAKLYSSIAFEITNLL